jgi:hypothetical protein
MTVPAKAATVIVAGTLATIEKRKKTVANK